MPLVGQVYRTDRATLVQGDCLDVLRCLEDGEADALVTDPPAAISFMQRKWDSFKSRDAFVDFLTPRFAECRRVCRPGAVGLVWALPRTSHWTALAVEEAGWYIEDILCHLFGTGYPKHKSKLKPGHEQWVLCRNPGPLWLGVEECRIGSESTLRNTTGARNGTSLNCAVDGSLGKSMVTESTSGRYPANVLLSHHPECVCQGRKKVKGTHRVCARGKGNKADPYPRVSHVYDRVDEHGPHDYTNNDGTETVENWTCHPDCPIRLLDEQAGDKPSGKLHIKSKARDWSGNAGRVEWHGACGDSGGPSRFFANFPAEEDTSRMLYCSKASKKDRGEGNRHNTVKSTTLMSWLVKLACPEGGLVLDPFAGSGSTGVACLRTGRRFLGIESDCESCLTAARRLRAEE
jgi:DNA modification methylase